MTEQDADVFLLPPGNARLLVAASWDPKDDIVRDAGLLHAPFALFRELMESFAAFMGAKRNNLSFREAKKRLGFDVDLFARIEGPGGKPVELIGPYQESYIDATGKIYHTGDDEEGLGAGDDEQIYAEYTSLPETISSISFSILSDCLYPLSAIKLLSVRVASAAENDSYFQLDVQNHPDAGCNFLVFARLVRDGNNWRLERLQDFKTINAITDWMSDAK